MMPHAIAPILMLCSMLVPARVWTPPAMPLLVNVKPAAEKPGTAAVDYRLVLLDFNGNEVAAKGSPDITGEKQVDLKVVFPTLTQTGTFVLFLVPKGKPTGDFVGTPLVIEARKSPQQPAPPDPDVYKMEPLRYALMKTDKGDMTMAFYFDVAPYTAEQFLRLSEEGFYNDLTFHRIIDGFVLQGGDPRGDGRGGPGYMIHEEFNDKPHEAGVLSMARASDVNSAGSQFFICLDYAKTKQLDGQYTAFGKVTDGMAVAQAMAKTPLVGDPAQGQPAHPPKIISVEVKAVTAGEDPYAEMLKLNAPATTQPAK